MAAQQTLPPHLIETPRIVNANIPQDDWALLGEMAIPEQGYGVSAILTGCQVRRVHGGVPEAFERRVTSP